MADQPAPLAETFERLYRKDIDGKTPEFALDYLLKEATKNRAERHVWEGMYLGLSMAMCGMPVEFHPYGVAHFHGVDKVCEAADKLHCDWYRLELIKQHIARHPDESGVDLRAKIAAILADEVPWNKPREETQKPKVTHG